MMDITDVTVTAMQRPVVTFTPFDPVPGEYTVTAKDDAMNVVATVTVPGTETVARFPQMDYGTYWFSVTDGVALGEGMEAAVAGTSSTAGLLRQAVFDAIYDAGIEDLATFFHDGIFRPVDLVINEVMDAPFPALEVSAAGLAGTEVVTKARCVETWAVPIRIWGQGHAGNPDTLQYLQLLRQRVQRAIHLSGNLGLGNRGVVDRSWSWTVPEEPLDEHEGLAAVEATLSVPVQRRIG